MRVTALAKRITALEKVNEQEAIRRKVYFTWGQRTVGALTFALLVLATTSQVFSFHL